ncbi:hect-domain (ubiquitin-transferase) domain-containing protein [Cyclospora cayetanensis]|uniref:Hect-domain (Ubiquitin-transferase) domain-containing protein n=1 Tax=Cyclospora cayetanensis TaxID=88456 RepID=A0A1D3D1F7_9EIME|nr:hect-domain (ubiquitin-transferase) domain-containing protein [Cyclospora cayetanensis]
MMGAPEESFGLEMPATDTWRASVEASILGAVQTLFRQPHAEQQVETSNKTEEDSLDAASSPAEEEEEEDDTLKEAKWRLQQLQQLGVDDVIRCTFKLQQSSDQRQENRHELPDDRLQVVHVVGEFKRLLGTGGGLALIPALRFGALSQLLHRFSSPSLLAPSEHALKYAPPPHAAACSCMQLSATA